MLKWVKGFLMGVLLTSWLILFGITCILAIVYNDSTKEKPYYKRENYSYRDYYRERRK